MVDAKLCRINESTHRAKRLLIFLEHRNHDPILPRPARRRALSGFAVGALAALLPRAVLDPTLVARTGARVRIAPANGLAEPTITHWHGFTLDTVNDGNGETLVAPGKTFEYAFTVRNRAGLYWYHPHPHGATASQIYRGLFGLFAVEDDEELALRRNLALVPGETELPLMMLRVKVG